MAGSNAAYKIISACSHAVSCGKLRQNCKTLPDPARLVVLIPRNTRRAGLRKAHRPSARCSCPSPRASAFCVGVTYSWRAPFTARELLAASLARRLPACTAKAAAGGTGGTVPSRVAGRTTAPGRLTQARRAGRSWAAWPRPGSRFCAAPPGLAAPCLFPALLGLALVASGLLQVVGFDRPAPLPRHLVGQGRRAQPPPPAIARPPRPPYLSFAPGYTWVPLDNMPLGCNGQAFLLARVATIEDIERCGRQPL